MAVFSIKDETLIAIADAIRSKAGTTEPISPGDMPGAIEGIPSGTSGVPGIQDHLNTAKSAENLFYSSKLTNKEITDLVGALDFSAVKRFDSCFYCALNLSVAPDIYAPNATYFQSMFQGCSSLKSVPDFPWSGNVTNVWYMFRSCSSLVAAPEMDTHSVTGARYMFSGCYNLTSVPAYDLSACTDMQYFFDNCWNIKDIPMFDTSKVTSMKNIFYRCEVLEVVPAWDITNVTTMSSAFALSTAITTIHLKNIGCDINISPCTKMDRDAIMEVIGNLKDLTGATAHTLTLGTTLKAKLSADDIAVATAKNWTVA